MEPLILTPRKHAGDFSWQELTRSRTALQTVLLAILLLVTMGVICSLSTRSLHKIILWFAPINST
jgi:hypothetical protein